MSTSKSPLLGMLDSAIDPIEFGTPPRDVGIKLAELLALCLIFSGQSPSSRRNCVSSLLRTACSVLSFKCAAWNAACSP